MSEQVEKSEGEFEQRLKTLEEYSHDVELDVWNFRKMLEEARKEIETQIQQVLRTANFHFESGTLDENLLRVTFISSTVATVFRQWLNKWFGN